MPSNHLILCRPLLLLPSVFPSVRVFSKESALHIRWLKYWSFSFSINPANEHSGLISFRMDWFDCLAVQGTLKSLFQHHSLKPSILWLSAFFMARWAFTSCCWESGIERAGDRLAAKQDAGLLSRVCACVNTGLSGHLSESNESLRSCTPCLGHDTRNTESLSKEDHVAPGPLTGPTLHLPPRSLL